MGSLSSLKAWNADMKHNPTWTIILESAQSIASGAAFGAALTAAGVHLPEVILDQFRLSNFRMFQVFTTALGSSIFIILGLDKLGHTKRVVRPATTLGLFSHYDGNIIGGVLTGLGMSLSGSCPGTVFAQLAQGVPSAGTTALGGLLGGMAHIWLMRTIEPRVTEAAVARTIPQAIGMGETTLYTGIGAAWLSLIYILATTSNDPIWHSAATGGILLGLSQLVSLLATSSTLGVTAVYDQAARYTLRLVDSKVAPPSTPPRSLLFAMGAVLGSWALTQAFPAYALTSVAALPWISALTGGFLMAFGAKLAKGCTSGHGLSGVGSLSLSSLISVASMFGAGILFQLI